MASSSSSSAHPSPLLFPSALLHPMAPTVLPPGSPSSSSSPSEQGNIVSSSAPAAATAAAVAAAAAAAATADDFWALRSDALSSPKVSISFSTENIAFAAVVALTLTLATLAACWLLRRRHLARAYSLDWEAGRRRARQPFRKSHAFYEQYGVQSTEDYFVSSRGVELFAKQWTPLLHARAAYPPPRAVVFYCHGYGDTCTHTFEDVAIRLAAEGFVVVSMDYEGHGLSSGLHGYVRCFSDIVEDVAEFTSTLRGRPDLIGLPFFLFGESMGGAVAIQTHRKQPNEWAGAVLLAPMCKIAEEMMPPPAVVFVLRILAHIFPTWKLVPTRDISEIGFRDPAKRQRVRQNPVAYCGKPRLSTALQLLLTTEDIGRNMQEVALPLLVLHGAEDVVTDPRLSCELVGRASSLDKTLRLYPSAWHGLTSGEPDDVAEVVMADIVSWLRSRSAHASMLMSSACSSPVMASLPSSSSMGSMATSSMLTASSPYWANAGEVRLRKGNAGSGKSSVLALEAPSNERLTGEDSEDDEGSSATS